MSLEERIKPALNFAKGAELSSEEFQQSLYDYFEEKGIISNLRAHLRSQLVNVLKETSLGKAILKNPEISPKIQAHNLLVAEYLLQRNYHYTLSVFTTEVPMHNAFPPIILDHKKKEAQPFHFSKNDLSDILEALGLNRQPDIAARLSHKYQLSKQSLLTCILHNVPKVIGQQRDEKDENLKAWLCKNGMASLDLEAMIMLLKTTGVNIDIILKICELVKAAVINEVRTLRKLKDMQMAKMKKHMCHQANMKKAKYKEKFEKLEAFYKDEKVRLEMELNATKERLREASSSVQSKYNDIAQLNNHIATLETRLKQQEQSLLTKEQSLQQRQEYLENKQRLIKQQFEEMQLISCGQQTKDPETKAVANIATGTDKQPVDADHQPAKCDETELLRRVQADQQNEIIKLKDQNLSYQNKIQELLLRTNTLMDEMESRAMRVRKTRKDHLVTSCAPLGTGLSYYLGAGEEGHIRSSPPPSARRFTGSSSSGDISPTDEVLRSAKLRLLELERESFVIDNHFDALPTTAFARASEANTACLLQSFQSNVTLIRESLNKIFHAEPKSNGPSPRITITASDENIVGEPVIYEKPKEKETDDGEREDEHVVDEGNDAGNSRSSSGIIHIDSSISTLDLSADIGRVSSQSEWVDIED